MNRSHLLVIAKSPVPGQVKTRLCPPCTPDEAAAIAEAALADTLDAVAAAGVDRRLLALAGPPGPWVPPGFEVFAQRGDTFAERLDHAWSRVDGPGLQIGMDTPQVTPLLLDECLSALDGQRDRFAALGPAADGGWWALAVRAPLPGMFDGVTMSASTTRVEQQQRLESLGFTVSGLCCLVDVDRAGDACVVSESIPDTRFGRLVASLDLSRRLLVDASEGPR
ncbi:MAG: hypothetical protein JWO62_2048 [Acidimicrobiaceae bacterium]|nr:hypothetical protein [Acidimicrobiaceae bacterium]